MLRTQGAESNGPWPNFPKFDIVFIRNVMITSTFRKQRILGRIYDLLPKDGYLFLALPRPPSISTSGSSACRSIALVAICRHANSVRHEARRCEDTMDDVIQCVGELSESVWAQTLGMELVPTGIHDPVCRGGSVEGRVHLRWWEGLLVLQCSTEFARLAAQVMFGRDSAADDLQDVEDAVGELTNIIGGNLKALVSTDGCRLSLPEVTERFDYHVNNPSRVCSSVRYSRRRAARRRVAAQDRASLATAGVRLASHFRTRSSFTLRAQAF